MWCLYSCKYSEKYKRYLKMIIKVYWSCWTINVALELDVGKTCAFFHFLLWDCQTCWSDCRLALRFPPCVLRLRYSCPLTPSRLCLASFTHTLLGGWGFFAGVDLDDWNSNGSNAAAGVSEGLQTAVDVLALRLRAELRPLRLRQVLPGQEWWLPALIRLLQSVFWKAELYLWFSVCASLISCHWWNWSKANGGLKWPRAAFVSLDSKQLKCERWPGPRLKPAFTRTPASDGSVSTFSPTTRQRAALFSGFALMCHFDVFVRAENHRK